MPGFFGIIGDIEKIKMNLPKNERKGFQYDCIKNDRLFIERSTIPKFLSDKVFEERGNYIVVTEGVIFNKTQLIEEYGEDDFFSTIVSMYKQDGLHYFKKFRGSFSGFFFDKAKNIIIIFNDHIGDKQIFYTVRDNELFFTSNLNDFICLYQTNNWHYSFRPQSAYYLLVCGFMIEDKTMFNEFKKLIPGSCIIYEKNTYRIEQYYRLDNTPNDKRTLEETINTVDDLFRNAIKRQYEKDIEYGFKHLVTLSAGLDSRMTTWVANDMGYGDNIVNFTFSQSDYLDESIPKEIANNLHHEWIFKFLNNGLCLKNIDEVVSITFGSHCYSAQSHSKSALDLIDKKAFGIIHTGQLGDVILGTFYKEKDRNKKHSILDGAISRKLSSRVSLNDLTNDYANQEIYMFYQRGFNGANQGLLIWQQEHESYSPFYDIDLLTYALSIPVELRYNHEFYFKWILKKYPKAADYKWEKIKAKISSKRVSILGKRIVLRRAPKIIMNVLLRKMGFRLSNPLNSPHYMNPFDYWYRTNLEINKFLNEYYKENAIRLERFPDLKVDCETLFSSGTVIEKTQVLTVLAFLKRYFG